MIRTAALTLMLLPAPLLAQEQRKPADPFVLPAGELTVEALIQGAAQYLGRNILYEAPAAPVAQPAPRTNRPGQRGRGRGRSRNRTVPVQLPQPIKLQTQIVTDREGCEGLLHSLLHHWDLVVVPVDGKRDTYEVVNLRGPRWSQLRSDAAYATPEQILARPSLKSPVITTVELKNTNAQHANNALRPFLAGNTGAIGGNSVQVGNVGNAKSLIVQGPQDQVAKTIRLIRLADVKSPIPEQLERLNRRIRKLEQRIEALLEKTDK